MGQRKTVLNIPAASNFSVTTNGQTTDAQFMATALGTNTSPDGLPWSAGLATDAQETLLILMNLTSITATNVTFFIDTLGDDSVWYPLCNSAPLTGALQKYVFTLAGQNSTSQEFGARVRLRWVVSGVGTVMFSGTIFGK